MITRMQKHEAMEAVVRLLGLEIDVESLRVVPADILVHMVERIKATMVTTEDKRASHQAEIWGFR